MFCLTEFGLVQPSANRLIVKMVIYYIYMKHSNKTGRNGPCHCGSGKKYKKCHEGQDSDALLPISFCKINDDFEDSGLAVVFVAREHHNDNNINLIVYLCDIFCLGVKDINIYPAINECTVEIIEEKIGLDFVAIDYADARDLVLGVVQYGRSLGFEPRGDWTKEKGCIESDKPFDGQHYTYGRDGRPFYITGPYDDYARIFSTLENSVGKGNFEYLIDERSNFKYDG